MRKTSGLQLPSSEAKEKTGKRVPRKASKKIQFIPAAFAPTESPKTAATSMGTKFLSPNARLLRCTDGRCQRRGYTSRNYAARVIASSRSIYSSVLGFFASTGSGTKVRCGRRYSRRQQPNRDPVLLLIRRIAAMNRLPQPSWIHGSRRESDREFSART